MNEAKYLQRDNKEKEKQEQRLKMALDKFFDNQELTKQELELVEEYREECIQYVEERVPYFDWDGRSGSKHGSYAIFNGLYQYYKKHLSIKEAHNCTVAFLKNKNVIELGGGEGYYNFGMFLAFKLYIRNEENYPQSYTVVDVNPPKKVQQERYTGRRVVPQGVKSEFLRYLLTIEDGSAIVISSLSLLRGEVIPEGKLGSDYAKFLTKEIARITPEGELSAHYKENILNWPILEKNGFEVLVDDSKAYIVRKKKKEEEE